jgi:hypothetical protein
MGNKYCFIVAYTDNYLPGFTALKNSIKKYMDVELIAHHGTSVRDTAIERFKIAYDICDKYDAICLMDADMFLTADCTLFFDIASKGFIVTGSNGMIIDFNRDFQKRYDVDLGSSEYAYAKIHTTVPIFINHENIDWFYELYNTRRIDHWDDFLFLNILGIKMGKHKRILCMPPYAFTGIHHWQMKPETAVMKKGNMLLSGTEEQIYMVHGKWWDKGWLQDLEPTMSRYFKDEQIGDRGRSRTYNAISILRSEFKSMLSGE